jgi:hypothetical protein
MSVNTQAKLFSMSPNTQATLFSMSPNTQATPFCVHILLISFQQQSKLRSTVPKTQPMFLSLGHATPYNVINNTASKRVLLT